MSVFKVITGVLLALGALTFLYELLAPRIKRWRARETYITAADANRLRKGESEYTAALDERHSQHAVAVDARKKEQLRQRRKANEENVHGEISFADTGYKLDADERSVEHSRAAFVAKQQAVQAVQQQRDAERKRARRQEKLAKGKEVVAMTEQGRKGKLGIGADIETPVSDRIAAKRAETRRLVEEQDAQYAAALARDREQAAEKERQREAKRRAKAELAEMLAHRRATAAKRLPAEPDADYTPDGDDGARLTAVFVTTPGGYKIGRRFLTTDTLGAVYDFVDTKALKDVPVHYLLEAHFPKRVFLDRAQTLADAELFPRVILHMIEDTD